MQLRRELKNIIDNNNKIIQAIEDNKKINIEKSIKACCISINRLSKIMFKYLIDDDYEEPNNNNPKSGGEHVDHLKDIFGFK